MTPEFLNQLQLLCQNRRNNSTTIRRETHQVDIEVKSANIIKVYDENIKSSFKCKKTFRSSAPQEKEEVNPKNVERIIPPPLINLEHEEAMDVDNQCLYKLGIAEVFQEIIPQNRGWLMRKSNRYENKWSMAFFEITDNKLTSVKPRNLKVRITRNILVTQY